MRNSVILAYLGEDYGSLGEERKAEIGLKKVPKLGLLYLSSILKQKGLVAQILDHEIQHISPVYFASKIKENKPLFVGIYCATQLKERVIYFIKCLRQNSLDVPVAIGGPGCFSGKEYLNAGADFVCNGEGEATILELADYLSVKIYL